MQEKENQILFQHQQVNCSLINNLIDKETIIQAFLNTKKVWCQYFLESINHWFQQSIKILQKLPVFTEKLDKNYNFTISKQSALHLNQKEKSISMSIEKIKCIEKSVLKALANISQLYMVNPLFKENNFQNCNQMYKKVQRQKSRSLLKIRSRSNNIIRSQFSVLKIKELRTTQLFSKQQKIDRKLVKEKKTHVVKNAIFAKNKKQNQVVNQDQKKIQIKQKLSNLNSDQKVVPSEKLKNQCNDYLIDKQNYEHQKRINSALNTKIENFEKNVDLKLEVILQQLKQKREYSSEINTLKSKDSHVQIIQQKKPSSVQNQKSKVFPFLNKQAGKNQNEGMDSFEVNKALNQSFKEISIQQIQCDQKISIHLEEQNKILNRKKLLETYYQAYLQISDKIILPITPKFASIFRQQYYFYCQEYRLEHFYNLNIPQSVNKEQCCEFVQTSLKKMQKLLQIVQSKNQKYKIIEYCKSCIKCLQFYFNKSSHIFWVPQLSININKWIDSLNDKIQYLNI